jgi:hypothetical protein
MATKNEAKVSKAAKEPAEDQDKASAEDKARLERDARKQAIIDEIALLDTRKEWFDEAGKQKREELRLLMSEDGDPKLVTEMGEAGFSQHREFKVHTPKALLDLFPNKTLEEKALYLAEKFKPTADFVDGATEAGLNVASAITIGYDERFKVERSRGKEAKAKRAQILEQTKAEYEFKKKQAAAEIKAGAKKGAK